MSVKEPMTLKGFESLKTRLRFLKHKEMPRISKEIGRAIEMGDLSENAEYHAAKEKQGLINAHIMDIEDKLSRSQVVDISKLGGDRVTFGATVIVEDLDSGEKSTFCIVGTDEADPANGMISYQSPIARSLISKEEGDEVTLKVPKGTRTLEILEVKFNA